MCTQGKDGARREEPAQLYPSVQCADMKGTHTFKKVSFPATQTSKVRLMPHVKTKPNRAASAKGLLFTVHVHFCLMFFEHSKLERSPPLTPDLLPKELIQGFLHLAVEYYERLT